MPDLQNKNDTLAASNEAEMNKASTLTALYQKQRQMKMEMEQQKNNTLYKELEADAAPEWDRVNKAIDEMWHHSHGYGAGWARLYDFIMVLNDALIKQSPIWKGKIGDFFAPVAAAAIVGARYALGIENNQIHYNVYVNEETGKLDSCLERTDGEKLTTQEKAGYEADVGFWLKGLGHSANDTFTSEQFAQLRDDPNEGLSKYFQRRQLEAKQTLDAPSMSM